MRCAPLALSVALLASSAVLAQETVRIATWNIGNLYAKEGVALRPNAAKRTMQDFEALRRYANQIDADIVALQEINSVEAAELVYPKEKYHIVVDGRRAADIAAGRRPPAEGGQGANETDGIYTAFAFRRGSIEVLEVADVPELGINHRESDGTERPTRWGLSALVRVNGQRFRLLNVHLKSACHQGRLNETSSNPHCVTLARQLPILEDWIDRRYVEGVPVIILGDTNRKIERHRQQDDLWDEIDDGSPHGLDLFRLPFRPANMSYDTWLQDVWKGCPTFHSSDPGPIDYFFFDDRAWRFVEERQYQYVRFSDEDAATHGTRLSDHCPSRVDLVVPRPS